MREILFRGKRLDNGKWVEGLPVRIYRNTYPTNRWEIVKGENIDELNYDVPMIYESYEVDPDTIGQYTGLTDMNGKKIFEGDILECWPGLDDHCRGYVRYGVWNCSCCHGVFGWVLEWHGDLRAPDTSLVIGNIWDNKELLDGMTQEGPDR